MENIRPIRTAADYEWALAEVTKYFNDQPEPGTADGDRFDVISTLIDAYEDLHYPIHAPDPVATIEAHMEMANLKRTALADLLGSKSRASEIMSRKRALTVEMIHKLNAEWGIPAEDLVRPYHLEGNRGIRE